MNKEAYLIAAKDMRRRVYKPRWGMPKDRREPMGVRISVLLILLNAFIWIGLRHMDALLLSLVSWILALAGWYLGWRGLRRIRQQSGRLSGEHMAAIGYWGNCVVFTLNFVLFAFKVATALIAGKFI